MSIDLIIWLAAFVLQSSLLGIAFYTLIILSDLENDFINPYDLSTKLNRWVVPEYALQIAITLVCCLSLKYFTGVAQLCMLAYLVKFWIARQQYIDATDAFKQLPAQKKKRTIILVFHLCLFVFITYRVIECALHSLLTPEGRQTAKRIFQEAAATLHGY